MLMGTREVAEPSRAVLVMMLIGTLQNHVLAIPTNFVRRTARLVNLAYCKFSGLEFRDGRDEI